MVTDSVASLAIGSTVLTSAEITSILGIQPSSSHEMGDPKGKARPDSTGAFVQRHYDSAGWMWHAPESDDTSDEGDSSLAALVTLFSSKTAELETLRADCRIRVWYTGHSDSTQGGFVFPAEVLAGLASLGCDFYGSVGTDFAHPDGGIVEKAILPIEAGREAEFEAAFEKAKWIVAESEGFRELTLSRGVENPGTYLLLIRWDSIEDHEVGFRGSPAYQEWRALLHDFYEPFPTVEHFTAVTRIVPER